MQSTRVDYQEKGNNTRWYSIKFYMGRLRPKLQPLPFWTPVWYLFRMHAGPYYKEDAEKGIK